ncbi:MAG: tetratricopeptide repeat protein [Thaumarchaeota archaeon]|nr:tetratricopeptide repeat protein [Nitrososphaerota archaeon]
MSERRRLAAIVFTDMVGYTTLSQRDEKLALSLLESQDSVLRSSFTEHNGRVVKGTGDGYLVEFGSALEAVESAIDAQQRLSEANVGKPPEAVLKIRIGIHVGDVVEKGTDIYGDAVNIASRTFPLADPGGICITEEVYSQVRNKLPIKMVKLGPQQLKHVQLPVNLYKVLLQEESKGEHRMAPKNRLAVLPLSNISPDPKDGYLADGMTEELITVLSRVQGLRVIARTSSDRYRGSEKRVSSIAEELEVGSVMEGSIRKAGEKIRVTVQLVDAGTEEHLWAETYDRDLTDIFSIQTEIAKDVADALKLTLLQSETKHMEKRSTSNMDAYMEYLKGRAAMPSRTREGLAEAVRRFQVAIGLDPSYAPAYAGLSDAYFLQGDYRYFPEEEAIAQASLFAAKALALDSDMAEAHASMGIILERKFEWADAEKEFKKAIELNPSYSTAHHWYSLFLAEVGRLEEAASEALLAEQQDPLSPIIVLNATGFLMFTGRPQEALDHLEKAKRLTQGNPLVESYEAEFAMVRKDYPEAVKKLEGLLLTHPEFHNLLGDLAYCYVQLGQREKAVRILEDATKISDEVTRMETMAGANFALGNYDEVFKALSELIERKMVSLITLRYLDTLEPLRKDPRWAEMWKKHNLP